MTTAFKLKKIVLATSAALSLGMVGALGSAQAQTTPTTSPDKTAPASGQHHHGGHERAGMHAGAPMGPMSDRMTQRLLSRVKASPEQKAQIQKIMEAAHKDMQAQGRPHEELRQQALALMAAPQLDAAAAEKLRQSMLAEHDKHTKAMLNTLLEVGKVLTPEQRKLLAEDFQKREARHGGRHGGGRGGSHAEHHHPGMMGGMGGASK